MIKYNNTGRLVKNKKDGKVGVVLREFETGQVQVLESFSQDGGKVINTHDSWNTLEILEEPDNQIQVENSITIIEEYISSALSFDDISEYENRLVSAMNTILQDYKRLRGDV